MFDELYVLSDPLGTRAYRGGWVLGSEGGPDAGALARGDLAPEEAVVVPYHSGSHRPMDVVWTSMVTPLIVSARVVTLWKEAGLTGWRTYPVRLEDTIGADDVTYHGIAFTGRCGSLDRRRSVPFIKRFPARAAKCYRGVFFDESSWDGSDFFLADEGETWYFVTERVRSLFHRHEIRNVRFTPMSEFEITWPWWPEGHERWKLRQQRSR